MYEQVSHSLLDKILDELKPDIRKRDLRHFYTRLGANFYAIYSLFHHLYGRRDDFEHKMLKLVEVMANQYILRDPALKESDILRERDHNWFLRQDWVGMALYSDGFNEDLNGLRNNLPYLQELGVNMVHVMPILECPKGASDGGYAVSNFRDVDERVGTLDDLRKLARHMRKRDMLLTLDVVVNHTSDEHPWAMQAKVGNARYQEYYYTFKDRDVPDMYEQTMPEIFPETSPGNFTYSDEMQRWVMSVFNSYQWDLNYSNPDVFIEMLDVILFWGNQGADIVRLDAVAFLWKKIGTVCQNEREAHLILQLMKDCCQVTAPGVLFIAEAIVAPVEVTKYFGEDAINAKECEIAYNATYMALLWDAVATKNTKLLNQGIRSLPGKLDGATWLNYVRCHDDIGLGFDDADIWKAGYEPSQHRRFLIDYLTGKFPGSPSRGEPFGINDKTGDARISGTLASLAGLESAIDSGDESSVQRSIDLILLLHSMVMAFGGIPLLYYGDEIGTINSHSYDEDPGKAGDNRWLHRPRIDWEKAENRKMHGSVEQRIFDGLRQQIAVRKHTPAFSDFNNRELIDTGNPHIFAYVRTSPTPAGQAVLVVGNFDSKPQTVSLRSFGYYYKPGQTHFEDICHGHALEISDDGLWMPAHSFYWLSDRALTHF